MDDNVVFFSMASVDVFVHYTVFSIYIFYNGKKSQKGPAWFTWGRGVVALPIGKTVRNFLTMIPNPFRWVYIYLYLSMVI